MADDVAPALVPQPGFKRYDSATVREWEPLAAALYDIQFSISCCDELLGNPDAAVEANAALQRALWDGVLVALFKHYGKGANKRVRALIDEVVESRGEADVDALGQWHLERNRRVAHSVGFREAQIVVVRTNQDGEPMDIRSIPLGALRPEDAGITWIRKVLVDIEALLGEAVHSVMLQLVDEVKSMSNSQLGDLPDLTLPFLGQGRAPGSKRESAQ